MVAERSLLESAEALTRGSPPAANKCRLCVASPFRLRPQEGLDPHTGSLDTLRSCAAVAARWRQSPPHRRELLAPVPASQKHRSLDTRRRNSCPLESECAETCVIPIPSHPLPRHCRGSRQGPAHWTEWLPLGLGGGRQGKGTRPASLSHRQEMPPEPACLGPAPAWLWLSVSVLCCLLGRSVSLSARMQVCTPGPLSRSPGVAVTAASAETRETYPVPALGPEVSHGWFLLGESLSQSPPPRTTVPLVVSACPGP